MQRLVVFFFGLSLVCVQAGDVPSSVMFWRYSVSGSCQEQGIAKYNFPAQIVVQERSRDNKALLSEMRFKFTSDFKYWNSYEQPPDICHVDNPLQPLEKKSHTMSATCYRGMTGEDRSGFTHRVKVGTRAQCEFEVRDVSDCFVDSDVPQFSDLKTLDQYYEPMLCSKAPGERDAYRKAALKNWSDIHE